jgi:glycosyltransferase involved in cell wall biosynthesis
MAGEKVVKIAVISSSVFACPPPGYAGLEMITWQQARGLAALGHEVSLIAPEGSTCPNVNIISTGPPGKWDEKKSYAGYWQHLPQFDCVIDSSWAKWSYILKKEGKLNAPVLGVMHAPINTMISSLPPVPKPCVVCISDDQKTHFEALFSHPAMRAYNGVDLDFYKPLEIPRTDRFLFLARFSSIKGADLAIEACLQAGVGLDLVGDTSITNEPDYFHHCQFLAGQTSPGWDRSKGKQIRMVGPATRGECVRWFSQAHALLHPVMRFREPFGLSPVEAMLCECPCISWDHGAMRETVGGRGGVLVKSMTEMVERIRQFHSPQELEQDINNLKFRKDVRNWATQFSVENMCKRYEELCELAVKEGGW